MINVHIVKKRMEFGAWWMFRHIPREKGEYTHRFYWKKTKENHMYQQRLWNNSRKYTSDELLISIGISDMIFYKDYIQKLLPSGLEDSREITTSL